MHVLADKVAIVTGASSGIGRATARLFAREGAKVVVSGRRQAELDTLVGEIEAEGGQAIAVAGDVRDEALAKALVNAAVERFGGLDIAFNNAGSLGAMGSVADVSLEGWRDTLDTNLTSAFLGAKYQVPAMHPCSTSPRTHQASSPVSPCWSTAGCPSPGPERWNEEGRHRGGLLIPPFFRACGRSPCCARAAG